MRKYAACLTPDLDHPFALRNQLLERVSTNIKYAREALVRSDATRPPMSTAAVRNVRAILEQRRAASAG